jgi:hypothetical protein
MTTSRDVIKYIVETADNDTWTDHMNSGAGTYGDYFDCLRDAFEQGISDGEVLFCKKLMEKFPGVFNKYVKEK